MVRLLGRLVVVGAFVGAQVVPAVASAASLIERLSGAAPATSPARAFVPLDGSPATISFYEDAPCPPAAVTHAGVRPHRRHRPPSARIARAAPKPHPHLVRVRHRIRPLHRPPLRIAAVTPARCEILHRETLYRPGLAIDEDALILVSEAVPTDFAPFAPETPVDTTPPAVRGLALVIPSPPLFGGGFRPFRPFTSAAPEPETWLLMLVGVGAAGVALRRRRRGVAAA